MAGKWSKQISVAEMYGDWDYDAAVEVLSRSLDPRPALSILANHEHGHLVDVRPGTIEQLPAGAAAIWASTGP